MRKLCSALLTVSLVFACNVAAYAQTEVSYTDKVADADGGAVVVDWSGGAGAEQSAPAPGLEPAAAQPEPPVAETVPIAAVPVQDAALSPVDVENVMKNGDILIKKTYELSPEADPQTLAEPFEQDGFSFAPRDILRQELPGETISRPAVKLAVTSTESDGKDDVLAQFPAYIDHEEDGFSGRLALNTSTIATEPEEYESYSYTYTQTQEFDPLGRNDPALLEKERQGMTLAGISFEGKRETQVGGSLIPSSYKGVATWKGTATDKHPVSYQTTATYTGEITKTLPEKVLYTVVYEGTLVQPDAPAPIVVPDESGAGTQFTSSSAIPSIGELERYLPILIGCAFPLGMMILFWIQTKKEREARRENCEALEEIAGFIRSGE